jgi:hypothetical protein
MSPPEPEEQLEVRHVQASRARGRPTVGPEPRDQGVQPQQAQRAQHLRPLAQGAVQVSVARGQGHQVARAGLQVQRHAPHHVVWRVHEHRSIE